MVSKPSSAGRQGPTAPQTALQALFAGKGADPLRRALWLDALEQRLRPHLPPSLAAHVRFANLDGAKLVYLVDSPVWRARLRLASPGLLDVARSLGLECDQVVIKSTTQPLWPDPPATHTSNPAMQIPAAAREALQAALASLDLPVQTAGEKTPAGRKKDES